MEEKRLERDFRLYHWAGSAENWVQEQNGGDAALPEQRKRHGDGPPFSPVRETREEIWDRSLDSDIPFCADRVR